MMQTQTIQTAKTPRTRVSPPSRERGVTIWVPAPLLADLDRKVEAQQAGLPPGSRLTRHALILAAIRSLVDGQP